MARATHHHNLWRIDGPVCTALKPRVNLREALQRLARPAISLRHFLIAERQSAHSRPLADPLHAPLRSTSPPRRSSRSHEPVLERGTADIWDQNLHFLTVLD